MPSIRARSGKRANASRRAAGPVSARVVSAWLSDRPAAIGRDDVAEPVGPRGLHLAQAHDPAATEVGARDRRGRAPRVRPRRARCRSGSRSPRTRPPRRQPSPPRTARASPGRRPGASHSCGDGPRRGAWGQRRNSTGCPTRRAATSAQHTPTASAASSVMRHAPGRQGRRGAGRLPGRRSSLVASDAGSAPVQRSGAPMASRTKSGSTVKSSRSAGTTAAISITCRRSESGVVR